jgi:hypothetical protein
VSNQRSLRDLANWLLLRSVGEHDYATTLTILERKVKTLRQRANSGHRANPETLPNTPPRSSSMGAGL